MIGGLPRRRVLAGAGGLISFAALGGCESLAPRKDEHACAPSLPRLRAAPDRITRITVCTRPFRTTGPNLEAEKIGHKLVIHDYGHGGSGWSLSWGSAEIVVGKALAAGAREIGVIGCGALGLTAAVTAQRAGLKVTIYAKELPPDVRSSFASGVWSPDSRIAFEADMPSDFPKTWEAMCRNSFRIWQTLVGLPNDPVQWYDRYGLAWGDEPRPLPDTRKRFVGFSHLVDDLTPHREELDPCQHPFGAPRVRRVSAMMFNLNALQRQLMTDFLEFGGHLVIREFHSPRQFAELREAVLINATGYGAKTLFDDDSIIPVRGQIARLVPQPEITYGLYARGVSMVPRRDGIVVQAAIDDDYVGFGDAATNPDRQEAETALAVLADVAAHMK